MITGLRIKDFQSIEQLDVDCGKITVFHGESDTGKSAIVRALYALAFNSYPTGHVRDGADASVVSVVTDAGVEIGAGKGKGTNTYQMFSTEHEPMRWDKVGTDVPPEVMSELGWRAIELDDGSRFTPHFHLQFDPPFLLTDSPSKRAKVLGSLTNVATLFAAVKMAGTWERRAKQRAEAQQDIIDRVSVEITPRTEALAGKQSGLDEVQVIAARARQMHDNAGALTVLLMKALAISEKHSLAKQIIEMMDASSPEMDRADELIPRIQGLSALFSNIMSTQADVEQRKAALSQTQAGEELSKRALNDFIDEHELCPLCGSDWHKHE